MTTSSNAGDGAGTASAKASSGSASDLPPPSERGELEPCPFCGCTRIYERGFRRFECPDCRAEGPPSATRAEAVAAWNIRALSAEAQITRLEAERDNCLREWENAYREYKAEAAETARLSALLDQAREVVDDALGSFLCTQRPEHYPADHWSNRASALLTRLSKTGGEGEEGVSLSQGARSPLASLGRIEALSDLEGVLLAALKEARLTVLAAAVAVQQQTGEECGGHPYAKTVARIDDAISRAQAETRDHD